MMRWNWLAASASLLIAGCATAPLPPDAVPVVAQKNKRFWFRDLRAVPMADGLAVSGYVVRKKGGFTPIPGTLHIEALADGRALDATDVRWRRINWRARSSGRFSAVLPASAVGVDIVRISYQRRHDHSRQ